VIFFTDWDPKVNQHQSTTIWEMSLYFFQASNKQIQDVLGNFYGNYWKLNLSEKNPPGFSRRDLFIP